jgi:hypothetical protein
MYDKENLQMYDKENLQMYDKEKGQKNKQWSTKHYTSTDRVTRTPIKTGVNSDTPEDPCKLL